MKKISLKYLNNFLFLFIFILTAKFAKDGPI